MQRGSNYILSRYSHPARRLVCKANLASSKRQALFSEDQCLTLRFGQSWRACEAGRRCFFCTFNFQGTECVSRVPSEYGCYGTGDDLIKARSATHARSSMLNTGHACTHMHTYLDTARSELALCDLM